MRIPYFRPAITLGFLLALFSSADLIASENIELTAQDVQTDLQAFRDDGKFTLVLFRYDGCKPCDEAETHMQQWYEQLDKEKVSALIINIDDAHQQEAVYARQSTAGIEITSLFTKNTSGFSDALKEITGNPYRAVPLFIFFGADGKFIADIMGNGVNWRKLDKAIANR